MEYKDNWLLVRSEEVPGKKTRPSPTRVVLQLLFPMITMHLVTDKVQLTSTSSVTPDLPLLPHTPLVLLLDGEDRVEAADRWWWGENKGDWWWDSRTHQARTKPPTQQLLSCKDYPWKSSLVTPPPPLTSRGVYHDEWCLHHRAPSLVTWERVQGSERRVSQSPTFSLGGGILRRTPAPPPLKRPTINQLS